jgi:hypothetical protein
MSGSSIIPQGYASLLHDDRYEALSFAEFQHTVHGIPVRQYVKVIERGVFARIVLTGLGSVGSRVLSEDQDFLLHIPSRFWIT